VRESNARAGEHQSGSIGTDADPANVSGRASQCAIVRGIATESSAAYELSNVVEMALKKALLLAAEGSVETVGKIAAELEARQPERFAGQNAAHAMRDANYLATGRSS
jgi:hypothetical protein